MRRLPALILLGILSMGCAALAHAKGASVPQYQTRADRKAARKQQKAQRKYAKAQKKAERKMLKTERKNSKMYPSHHY